MERAYSHYLMDVREGLQDLQFRDSIKKETGAEEKEKLRSVSQLYVELGLYAEQVRRYL